MSFAREINKGEENMITTETLKVKVMGIGEGLQEIEHKLVLQDNVDIGNTGGDWFIAMCNSGNKSENEKFATAVKEAKASGMFVFALITKEARPCVEDLSSYADIAINISDDKDEFYMVAKCLIDSYMFPQIIGLNDGDTEDIYKGYKNCMVWADSFESIVSTSASSMTRESEYIMFVVMGENILDIDEIAKLRVDIDNATNVGCKCLFLGENKYIGAEPQIVVLDLK
ncbi:MAG: hypothetical protein R3Y32_00010 [Bacillota bacterium]